jgi:hypothetical protein
MHAMRTTPATNDPQTTRSPRVCFRLILASSRRADTQLPYEVLAINVAWTPDSSNTLARHCFNDGGGGLEGERAAGGARVRARMTCWGLLAVEISGDRLLGLLKVDEIGGIAGEFVGRSGSGDSDICQRRARRVGGVGGRGSCMGCGGARSR